MKQSVLLGLLAATTMVASSLTQWLLYAALGVGRPTDTIVASMAVPQMFVTVIVGPMASVLVPTLSDLADGRHREVASALALRAYLLGGLGTLALMASAPAWVPLLLPGFEQAAVDLVVDLTRIQLIGVIIAFPHGVALASAQAKGHFLAIELAETVIAIAVAALMIPVVSMTGIYGASCLFAGRFALRTLCTLPFSAVRPTTRLTSGVEAEVAKLATPLALFGSLRSSETFLNQFLASMAPEGALSLFNLAKTLHTAGYAVVAKAVTTPKFPLMGRLAKGDDMRALVALVRRSTLVACAVVVVALVFLATVGEPVLSILIGHGGITDEDVRSLWVILIALGGLPLGLVWAQAVIYGVYALGNTTRLTAANTIAFFVGAGLKVLGFSMAGVVGLAIGTSAYNLAVAGASTLVLAGLVRRRR